MNTLNQLIRNPRVPKKRKKKLLVLKTNWNSLKRKYFFSNNPQKAGTCKRIGVANPKKPNSANRAYARVILRNKKEVTTYIPGERHKIEEYALVLISGRGAKDLPGVKCRVIRGWGRRDAEGVEGRKQGRSLYGTKKSNAKEGI